MEILAKLLGSSIFGAIFGLIGNVVTAWSTAKARDQEIEILKLNNDHELLKLEKESEIMTKEAQAKIEVAREDTRGKEISGYMDSFLEAQKSEGQTLFRERYMEKLDGTWVAKFIAFVFAMVDIVKSTIRPVMTYYVIGATTWITWICWDVLTTSGQQAVDIVKALSIFDTVVYFILFMTSSVFHFWFVDRRTSKNVNKLLSNGRPTRMMDKGNIVSNGVNIGDVDI